MQKHLYLISLLIQTIIANAAQAKVVSSDFPSGIYQIPSINFTTTDGELEIIGKLINNAEIVALGEAEHTDGTFHKTNARIAKYLIEMKGFRFLTLETPHRASSALSKYISCNEQIDLPYALQRIFPQFVSMELVELYNWVRQFNCSHPNDKVSFTGFDVQQNRFYIPNDEMDTYFSEPFLENYIRKNIPSLMPNISDLQFCGPTASHYSLPQSDSEFQKCLNFLGLAFSSVNQVLPSDQFEIMTALISLFQNAQGKRYGFSDVVNSNTWRDIGMAKMISMIRAKVSPNSKMIIIAHNAHILRSPLQYLKNMGSYLDDEFGNNYFVIANISSQLVALPFYSLNPNQPNSNSVEAKLSNYNKDNLLINARNNSDVSLKQGLEIQADRSTGLFTPYVPISKLTDLIIYSRTSVVMNVVPGVQYPPPIQP